MKLLIDKLKLKLLLEKRRQHIGHRVEGLDVVLTGLLYVLSLLCSDFRDIMGVSKYVFATISWIVGLSVIVYGFIKIGISYKNRYSHNILYNEIENLDEILHKFSLAVIKDTFNEFPNKFLLYKDKAWNCWFFFSFPTSDYQNEASIIQRLSNKLKIDANSLSLAYISDRIQPKYSKKDEVNKVYQHSLYYVQIDNYPDNLKQPEFVIDGVEYRWMTIEQMEENSEIQETNGDVISFVKERIG